MADATTLARDFYAAYNARNAGDLRRFLAADYHHQRNALRIDGATEYIAYLEGEWAGRPDASIEVVRLEPTESGVVVEGIWSATSSQPLTLPGGITLPATGVKASLPFVSIVRAGDGVLEGDRMYYDTLGFWRSFGHTVTIS